MGAENAGVASPENGSEGGGARKGSKCVECRQSVQRGLDTKVRPGVDAHGMPVKRFVTEGTRVDCSQVVPLIRASTPGAALA